MVGVGWGAEFIGRNAQGDQALVELLRGFAAEGNGEVVVPALASCILASCILAGCVPE